MNEIILVYITTPNVAEAKKIASALVQEKLAACANIFPIQSAYWWEGKIENGKEWVSLLKTASHLRRQLQEAIERLHPYEVPCIMQWEVIANKAYENWISASVMSEEEAGRL